MNNIIKKIKEQITKNKENKIINILCRDKKFREFIEFNYEIITDDNICFVMRKYIVLSSESSPILGSYKRVDINEQTNI